MKIGILGSGAYGLALTSILTYNRHEVTMWTKFEEEAEIIASSIKSGKCVKTVRFENSLDLENITAKFANGIVLVTIPKLIIPKHKINVE